MSIKRITTEQYLELLFKIAKEEGRLGYSFEFEGKDISLDYFSSSNYERKPAVISNYEYDLIAYPEFGGSEGIYASIYLQGYFYEGQSEWGREHVGTVKSLDTDKDTMEAMGCICGNLAFHSSRIANGMIGRLTPSKEIEKDISYAEERGKKKFIFPFLTDADNAFSNERGFVLCLASTKEDADAWFSRSLYAGSTTQCLTAEEFRDIQTNLQWLDYASTR